MDCPQCPEKFSSRGEYYKHANLDHIEKILDWPVCLDCLDHFPTQVEIVAHGIRIHSKEVQPRSGGEEGQGSRKQGCVCLSTDQEGSTECQPSPGESESLESTDGKPRFDGGKCELCLKTATSGSKDQPFDDSITNAETSSLTWKECPKCSHIFSDGLLLECHLADWHGPKVFRCDICSSRNFTTKSKQRLIRHANKHHYDTFSSSWPRCSRCDLCLLPTAKEVRLHVKKCHSSAPSKPPGTRTFRCPCCSRSFSKADRLTIHANRVHNKGLVEIGGSWLKCSNCLLAFPTLKLSKRHNCQDYTKWVAGHGAEKLEGCQDEVDVVQDPGTESGNSAQKFSQGKNLIRATSTLETLDTEQIEIGNSSSSSRRDDDFVEEANLWITNLMREVGRCSDEGYDSNDSIQSLSSIGEAASEEAPTETEDDPSTAAHLDTDSLIQDMTNNIQHPSPDVDQSEMQVLDITEQNRFSPAGSGTMAMGENFDEMSSTANNGSAENCQSHGPPIPITYSECSDDNLEPGADQENHASNDQLSTSLVDNAGLPDPNVKQKIASEDDMPRQQANESRRVMDVETLLKNLTTSTGLNFSSLGGVFASSNHQEPGAIPNKAETGQPDLAEFNKLEAMVSDILSDIAAPPSEATTDTGSAIPEVIGNNENKCCWSYADGSFCSLTMGSNQELVTHMLQHQDTTESPHVEEPEKVLEVTKKEEEWPLNKEPEGHGLKQEVVDEVEEVKEEVDAHSEVKIESIIVRKTEEAKSCSRSRVKSKSKASGANQITDITRCERCQKTFAKGYYLDQHRKSCLRRKPTGNGSLLCVLKGEIPMRSSRSSSLNCHLCSETFKASFQLNFHLKQVH